MTMRRIVASESLDHLSEHDPAAIRSRRDLRRVHRAMGTRTILRRALRKMTMHHGAAPLRVLELGAGDGSLMLGVARDLGTGWSRTELNLLDRLALVDATTVQAYAQLGWVVRTSAADVLDWASDPAEATVRWDVIIANLFMHHFEPAPLEKLLEAIASRTDRFFACEPSRSWFALAGSHLIGALGANAVTREDAVLSVHAGFRDDELARSWPSHGVEWQLHEYSAGLFSHCFRAERLEVD
jgi:hypothetical protein